jgi:hypothetical protein
VIDDDEITAETLRPGEVREYDSFEDAYAALYRDLEPGQTLVIHDGECALTEEDPGSCSCDPIELTKGISA